MSELDAIDQRSWRAARVTGIVSPILVVPLVLGLRHLVVLLNGIPNSAAAFGQHHTLFESLCLTAEIALLALGIIAWRSSYSSWRRCGRLLVVTCLLTPVLWMLPIPFTPQRAVVALLLYICVAVNAVTLVQSTMDAWWSERERRPPAAAAPLTVLAGAIAITLSLLLTKLNALSWAYAMD